MLAVTERAAAKEGLKMRCMLTNIGGSLPVKSGGFDLLVCALTLCHVPDLYGAIRELHPALAPGGYLLITDVHPDFAPVGMAVQFNERGTTYQS